MQLTCLTRASETSNSICAGGFISTVHCTIEIYVVDITLINLITSWKIHVSLAVVTISTVCIGVTSSHSIGTSVVVLVTHSVAAVVRGGESKPG